MTDERAENARRIRMGLAQGLPLDRIFPTVDRRKLWTPPPPDPWATREAEFVATDQHNDGSPLRSYVLACKHGKNELSLLGHTEADDPLVLENMLRALHARTGCDCPPRGWRRVEVGAVQ